MNVCTLMLWFSSGLQGTQGESAFPNVLSVAHSPNSDSLPSTLEQSPSPAPADTSNASLAQLPDLTVASHKGILQDLVAAPNTM